MSRDHDFTKPADGSTTFGVLYRYLRSNFLALASHFWGPLDSAPSGLLGGMLFWRRTSGVDALKYYDGTTEKHLTDGLPEITAARGSAASLNARLGVALNADGTIKGDAPASDWWSSETGTVVRESDTSFSITGVDRSHIYTDRLALAVTDDSDSITYHYVSGDSVYSTDTTVTVTGTLPAAIALVEFGQPVPNAPSTVSEVTTADLDAVRNDLLAEAMRRGIGDGTGGREYLGDGWLDPLADAGEVTITNGSFVSSDGGYLTNAGADDQVTALDLTTAQFLDEKGNITTFTVDTANTSGHFNAAKGARVVAGCRMVIDGVSYPILSITGDGTAANSVTIIGTLTTGAKTVSGIYGLAVSGAARLSGVMTRGSTDFMPTMTGYETSGVSIEASSSASGYSAWRLFDGILSGTSGGAWICKIGSLPVSVKITHAAPRTLFGYKACAVTGYLDRTASGWTLHGSNDGVNWTLLDTQSGITLATWTAQNELIVQIAEDLVQPFLFHKFTVTGSCGTSYAGWTELELYEATYPYPSGTLYPAALSLDCTDWAALKALACTETLNSQNIWYALSFDGGTTYSAYVSGAWLPIVRNNAGTWQYWTGSAWAASTINSALGAMVQAAGVSGNRMTGATMAALSQAQIEGAGGFVPLTQTNLPVLVALYSASSTATPVLSAMSMTSDIQAHDAVFEFDSFEAVDPELARVAFVLHTVDDVTLDTDLIARVRRGTGDWIAADLEVESRFDDTAVLVVGDADLSAGSGTDTVLRLTSANHKEFDIRAVSCMFKEVA